MRRGILLLVIFLLLLAAPFAVRYLGFYGFQGADETAPPEYELTGVAQRVPTPPAFEFEDEPNVGEGLVLLDEAHDNSFELGDISFLDSRLAARGFELHSYQGGDLAAALRPVNAFIVIAPLRSFDADEARAVRDFVERGGRLLLAGDPTRFTFDFGEDDFFQFTFNIDSDEIPLNSLANEFDLVFNGDYLYNTVENEGNFRNIVLKDGDFADSDLTDQVSRLAFYGSHSIQVGTGGRPLLTADDNTWSSATDRPGDLVMAALGADDRVLAVGDIDFLSEPYFTVFDNSRFIAEIADFLTEQDRDFVLADFPYFFEESIDLVFTGDPSLGPDAFDEVIRLQDAFRRAGKRLDLAADPSAGNDVLYLGLYNQSEEVADLLEAAGVLFVIDPPIFTDEEMEEMEAAEEEPAEEDGTDEEVSEEPVVRQIESDLGDVQMSGTALILLQRTGGRHNMVVLAASGEGLETSIDRLVELIPIDAANVLSDCVLQGPLALCPTGVADEEVEAELETGGAPEPMDEEPAADDDEADGAEIPEIGAVLQGTIAMSETVEATLGENQAHAWTFSDGPALVDIILLSGEEMDGVLELYDPDFELIDSADGSFTGEEERLQGIDIPDDAEYTIVVRDFFDEGGDYSLTVQTGSEGLFGTIDQGELPFDLQVSGNLGESESHSWRFTIDTETTVTIILQSGEEMDGFLVLLDPDDVPLEFADGTGIGGEERIESIVLTDAGEYAVVVEDFAGAGGEYTLLLQQEG